jgi:hypothetical protein
MTLKKLRTGKPRARKNKYEVTSEVRKKILYEVSFDEKDFVPTALYDVSDADGMRNVEKYVISYAQDVECCFVLSAQVRTTVTIRVIIV